MLGCLFDDSRIITECRVTAVYDAMYHVYFYAATEKIEIMALSLGLLGIFTCAR
jgi:hypothetical protein